MCVLAGVGGEVRADDDLRLTEDLRLDRVTTWTDSAGLEYVGWPREDAEALLHLFEVRLPMLRAQVGALERLVVLKDRQVELEREAAAAERARAETYAAIADSWRQTARDAQPSTLDRILRAPELWFTAGIATAVLCLVLLGAVQDGVVP